MKPIRLATILFPITFVLISLFWNDRKEVQLDKNLTFSLYLSIDYCPVVMEDTTKFIFVTSSFCRD